MRKRFFIFISILFIMLCLTQKISLAEDDVCPLSPDGKHSYTHWAYGEFLHQKTCEYCTKALESSLEDHTWSQGYMGESGGHYRTCTKCHAKENKTEHSYGEWRTVTQPTCEEPGKRMRNCNLCRWGNVETIPATGHKYEWVENDSEHYRICKICKDESTIKNRGKHGNWVDEQITKRPTCTTKGEEISYCGYCNYKKITEIPKTAHKWGNYKRIEDPNVDDYHTMKCSECGTSVSEKCDYSGNWNKTSTGHYKLCTKCGGLGPGEAHDTKGQNGTCSVCGAKIAASTPTATPTPVQTPKPTPKPTSTGTGPVVPKPTPSTPSNFKRGDVNCNGSVTITDLMILKKHIVQLVTLKDQGLKNADVDENGTVGINDLMILKKHIVNIPTNYTW